MLRVPAAKMPSGERRGREAMCAGDTHHGDVVGNLWQRCDHAQASRQRARQKPVYMR